jgi:hypothetical protein
MSASAGQLLSGSKEDRSDALSRMVRVNADLLDMGIAVEYLQADEAESRIPLVHGDQESAVLESRAVDVGFRRWRVGYAVHAGSSKQPFARFLKRADQRQLTLSSWADEHGWPEYVLMLPGRALAPSKGQGDRRYAAQGQGKVRALGQAATWLSGTA